jgi:hypothetical protein
MYGAARNWSAGEDVVGWWFEDSGSFGANVFDLGGCVFNLAYCIPDLGVRKIDLGGCIIDLASR